MEKLSPSRTNSHTQPRIFPEGEGLIDQSGLDFYSRLIDELLKHDIAPFITLFYWDLPLALQNRYRGFENRRVSELFDAYAKTVVKQLGNRIKLWITINEPFEFSAFGHLMGAHAPRRMSILAYFLVMYNLLLANGLAMERIRGVDPQSKIDMVVSITPVHPRTHSEKDKQAAMIANQFMNHITLHSLYK
jgi:beta-glucosidase